MSRIKIFVSHRIDQKSELVQNDIYIPVRCGAALDQDTENDSIIGDNTGDNISKYRDYFGEITVQYWAWKNIDADYYGLCHYRRYLSFAKKKFDTDEKNQVIEEYLSKDKQLLYGFLDEKELQQEINSYDAIVSEYADVEKMYTPRGNQKTVYEHFCAYDNYLVNKEDIDYVIELFDILFPDYSESVHEYFFGNKFRGYNCYILKKELFFELCQIEYKIIKKFHEDRKIDFERRSSMQKRTYGFICEWIYGIFMYHKEKNSNIRIEQKQLVFFQNTEIEKRQEAQDDSIPIVYETSKSFLPITLTSINSIILNKKMNTKYSIILLHNDFTKDDEEIIRSWYKENSQIELSFVNTKKVVINGSNGVRYDGANILFGVLMLPWILNNYDKVIFLHSDTIVEENIEQLWEIDFKDKCIAACRDYIRICEKYRNKDIKLFREKYLQIEGKDMYFSPAVMVMNLKKIREIQNVDNCLRQTFMNIGYQNSINKLFTKYFFLLEAKWNVPNISNNYVKELMGFLPSYLEKEYKNGKDNLCIRHYLGYPKPWETPYDLNSYHFFRYMNLIPNNYVIFLDNYINKTTITGYEKNKRAPRKYDRFIPNKVRKYVLDKAPYGTLRRRIIDQISMLFIDKE